MSAQDEGELRDILAQAVQLGRKLEYRKSLTTNQGGIPHPELYEQNHIKLWAKKITKREHIHEVDSEDELRKTISQKVDWFTEPGTGEKYLRDFEEDLVAFITSREQVIRVEARQDQTFKVIQSLVKSGSISDSTAAAVLALHSTNKSLEEK